MLKLLAIQTSPDHPLKYQLVARQERENSKDTEFTLLEIQCQVLDRVGKGSWGEKEGQDFVPLPLRNSPRPLYQKHSATCYSCVQLSQSLKCWINIAVWVWRVVCEGKLHCCRKWMIHNDVPCVAEFMDWTCNLCAESIWSQGWNILLPIPCLLTIVK